MFDRYDPRHGNHRDRSDSQQRNRGSRGGGDLPYERSRVRFPDARIEFEDRNRQEQHRDIEVVTPHYRGAHAAAVARSGFQSYAGGLRLKTSGRHGGRGLNPRLAEELLE